MADATGTATAYTPSRLERWTRRSQLHHLIFGARRTEPAPIFLGQRRVYVLPTLHGVTFGMALALMLIGSVNYSLSLGFVLTFLLVGVSLVGMVHTYRNLLHLYVLAGRCEPVFAGGRALFPLHLENRNRFDRLTLTARAAGATATGDVAAGTVGTLTLGVPAAKRGWARLDRITLETRYPLGLFRAWSYVHPDLAVLVYPQPELTDLPPEQAVPDSGDVIEIGAGNDDFAGLRTYQPSDSLRHVAWKVAARTETMLVKVWSGRGAAELWLDWNDLPRDLDAEARLGRLCGWVLRAEETDRVYGLRLPGVEIAPGRGPQHRDQCLKSLALWNLEDDRASAP